MTGGWVAVTRKDFKDAIRSRWIWLTTVLFVLFAGGATYLYASFEFFHGGDPSAAGLVSFVRGSTTLFVPIIALLAGHRSIAGEREDGSVKLLLSMPVTRRDVVVGKLLGRTGVVVVPAVLAYCVAAGLAVAMVGRFDYLQFVAFGLVTGVYALAYVSVAVGISASTGSTSKAVAGAVGFWGLFQFLWGQIAFVLLWSVNGFQFPFPEAMFDPVPSWYVLFTRLSPTGAFEAASSALLPGGAAAAAQPSGMGGGGEIGFSMPSGPFYVEDWFGVVMLVGWILLPAWIGYRRFRAADL